MSKEPMLSPARTLRVLVSGVDFGWGSAGKLSSVVEALAARIAVEAIGVGTELGRPVLAGHHFTQWRQRPNPDDHFQVASLVAKTAANVAVVVLDPALATALQRAGCPVVYIDSLPFLWTDHDPLPVDVSLYCAQKTLPLSPAASRAMARVKHLKWVAPIVPATVRASRAETSTRRGDGFAVVNLGGLHSPFTGAGDHSYQQLVLEPALRALADLRCTRVVITGNIEPDAVPAGPNGMAVYPRRYPHAEFTHLLAKAEYVLTSPGLTTICELAALGRNAVLLPPQNLSQVFNGDLVATGCDPRLRIPWPDAVLRRADVRSWHREGEEHAVQRIRDHITRAAQKHPVRAFTVQELSGQINKALRRAACASPSFSNLAQDFGGADQVAQEVLALTRHTDPISNRANSTGPGTPPTTPDAR
ncbi:hydroxymethylcytosylglucuronate/cytosylglucuronate synthase [Streptomyces sp. NPDC101150]|uniref:hydroxymethylcytosylglucuronate/cytosylglucurona te synthase n=1 Tax=Streptomyces sp. NPDC101150 TaxID=3366114 RepID=UPI003802DD79